MCCFFRTYANSKSIIILKNMVLIQDLMCNSRYNGEISKHSVGSKGEGTAIEGSDSDDMYIWEKIMLCQPAVHKALIWEKVMVCQNAELAQENKCVVFVLDRTDCKQGYTKLKLIINDTVKEVLLKKGKTIMHLTKETPNGNYLSNRKVINFFSQFLNASNIPLKVYRHGPCATAVFGHKYDPKNEVLPDEDHDHAQGFRMYNLTEEGEHWLQSMDASTKQRHWPTAETIRKISTLKCEVVAVGDHDSAFLDPCLKWRISYTLWERELIWSFQDVQIYCYVFLKIFLKRKLKYKSEDITSFHVKNVVFWESLYSSCEMLERKTNFLSFVKKCLIRLQEAIDKQRLQHFIDRKRNLFESKLTDEKAKRKLISYLDEELIGSHKLVPVVFECIGRDNLKALWDWCGSNPTEFLSKLYTHDEYARVGNNPDVRRSHELYIYGMAVWEIKSEVLLDTSDEMLDRYLKNVHALSNIGVEKEFVGITETILRFHYKLMSAEIQLCTDKDLKDYITYRKERYTDALSDRLYLSTCLIRYGKFLEAEVIINEFSNTVPKLYMYCGQCSDCFGIAVERGKVTYVQEASLDVTNDKFPFVYDILISNLHNDCFPPAIKIQISLENYLYLNPVVYMYYLKVLCYINTNRNAGHSLQRLYESAHQSGLKRDNFRHLNLLGHAYILTKRYRDAYVCFMKSICDNVSRNAQNSVFYLLWVLIHQMLYYRRNQKFPDISVLYSR